MVTAMGIEPAPAVDRVATPSAHRVWGVLNRDVLVLALPAMILCLGCDSGPRTEVIVSVDSNLSVPSELDHIRIDVVAPDGTTQSSQATLGEGQPPLPRTLGLVHTGGAIGPFEVTVTGLVGGAESLTRLGRFTFVVGQTLAFPLHLVRSCRDQPCSGDATCTETGCQSPDSTLLVAWTGQPPRLGEVPDMGMPIDACRTETCNGVDDDCDTRVDEEVTVRDEVCNGKDDDCNGVVDDGFDLQTDPTNCGDCGVTCVFRNAMGTCSGGSCIISACDSGFGDCDNDGVNGCEVNLQTDASHCNGCGNRCRNPDRLCCTGGCQRSCP